MKINSTVSYVLLGLAIFASIIIVGIVKKNAPSKYDDFAQCITDNGGQMLGAYWCPNCSAQKERFGSAFRKIDYVECSSPGSQTFDLCPEITGVPLWTRADGEETTGNAPLSTLAEFYGCTLPE